MAKAPLMPEGGRLTLRGIEVFVAVMEEGSVAAAARRLGASPSTVSQQITNLETALGARLVERSARPLALTGAGQVFARRAAAILGEAERARSELATLALARLPRLRLAVVEDLDGEITPALAALLAARLPGCEIEIRSGPSHLNIDALGHRAVDLVIAADEGDAPDWVERHPLLRDPYMLAAAPRLVAGGVSLPGLMAAPMIRFSEALFMGRQTERHLHRLRAAPPRRVICHSTQALFGCVARLDGWALVTPLCWLSAGQAHGGVSLAPNPFPGFARRLSLMARRGPLGALPAELSDALRGMLAETAVAAVAAAAPWLGAGFRVLPPEEDAPAAEGG
ncbi:LysR family transcriptional regulator [Paralimibaculum aggregatum]|uniref:LysR family transcriptional regulator n=1 Tax=Paralimibaculum aggregatum TaxID=3036245 RepID=A0ABQ6LQT1_9RHOB|nr:LysR family transcriptional regulator [Limibaculum sp. NKW23]GMG84013.1 LysR family transcriptional regulator [Limibaculum sp. NKW23]